MEKLRCRSQNEQWIINKVASPQPPRFLKEPKEPLQTDTHHPTRRLSHASAKEVKSRTDTDEYFPFWQNRDVLSHEFFLLRHADSNPKETRSGFAHFFQKGAALVVAERPKWRRKSSCYLQTGKTGLQAARHFLSYTGLATVEKMAESGGARMFAQIQN